MEKNLLYKYINMWTIFRKRIRFRNTVALQESET